MPDSLVQFSMLMGLDGKKDQRVMPLGSLATAQNVAYDRSGAVEKRPGNVSQGDTVCAPSNYAYPFALPATIPVPLVGGAGMFALGNEQVLCDGARIYCQSPTLAQHSTKDEIPEAVGTRKSLSSNSNTQFYGSDVCQTANGYRVYVWLNGTSGAAIFARIYDATSGALLWSNAISLALIAANGVKVTAVGNFAVFTYVTGGGLRVGCLTPANIGTASPVVAAANYSIATVSATFQSFDACSNQAGNQLVFAAQLAAGEVTIQSVNVPAMTNNQSATLSGTAGYTALKSIGICENAGNIWLAASNGTSGAIYVQVAADSSIGSPTSSYTIASPLPAGVGIGTLSMCSFTTTECVLLAGRMSSVGVYAQLIGTGSAVASSFSYVGAAYGFALGAVGTMGPQLLGPASKPAVWNGRAYALLYYPSATQGTYFWCDLECTPASTSGQPRSVATIAPRQCNSVILNSFCIPNVAADGLGNFYAPCSIVEGGGLLSRQGKANVPANRLWETRLNFAHPATYLGGNIGRSYNVGSSVYDGSSITELGFLTYPEGFTGALTAGGSLMSGAVYQYMILYEWTSATGETIRSTACQAAGAQALTIAPTGGGFNSATLTFWPPPLTAKMDLESSLTPPVITIYRTTGLAGTTFQYLASVPITSTSYLDQASDASIANNPLMYFQPGVQGTALDGVCPPSSSFTFTTQGRTFLLGDDLRTWWFTNQGVEGVQALFNEGLSFSLLDAGDFVGGATLSNGNIVLFASDRIYYTYGTGPTPTGTGSFYPTPVRVQGDVGCIDPRSILAIPDGILFLSAKGWIILGQDMSINFLTPPADVLAAYPNVTSAVLVPARSEIRIALNNGTNGVDLVASYWAPTGQQQTYSYRWSWSSKYDAVANFPAAGALGIGLGPGCMSYAAALVNGAYRWCSSAGNPYTEDTSGTIYLDCVTLGAATAANWVTLWVESSWLNSNGPVGWQRVKRASPVGDWFTPHDLYLQVATNFVESYTSAAGTYGPIPQGQTEHFVSTVTDSAQWEQVRTIVMNQKNQAVRLSLYDAPPTGGSDAIGSGRGFSLAAFGMLLSPKDKIGKLLASNRQG